MERKQLFRLCHVCDCLNESETEILKCVKCGKSFLPVNYFEKIKQRASNDNRSAGSSSGSSLMNDQKKAAQFDFNPLTGLLVFW